MNKEFLTHWVLGIACALVWFWGDKVGIPKDAQILAASTVPGLLAHALGKGSSDPAPLTPQQPEQSS